MKRILTGAILAAIITGGVAEQASAFWLDALWCHCETGYKKNVRWPSPYLCADRRYAHAPFDTMIRNGWRRQNLLGAHHFASGGTKLTQAGELRVRYILTQVPPEHRQLFVERSIVDGETQSRIATAEEFAGKVALDGATPSVTETHLVSEGRPAAVVDYVNTQFQQNQRLPTLPVGTGGGAGGE